MVAFASGGRKEGREKIPELSVDANILWALLRRSPRTWGELEACGLPLHDTAHAMFELILVGGQSFLAGPGGVCLHRWQEGRSPDGTKAA
jgi:hypothetical protein